MTNNPYPQASLLDWHCSRCVQGRAESGGYRVRKHRDLGGVREEKVLRVRCQQCKRSLGCIYPAGVMRHKWYSQKIEGIFAVLAVHQVNEACSQEIAGHLGYRICPETRASWQATRAFRAEQLAQKQSAEKAKVTVASIDEFKLGVWWMYTLTEVKSQAVVAYALCQSRDEEVVRELIAEHDPELIISDGCKSIQAACEYFADKPHGRCWFHVIKEVLKQFPRAERELVALDLRFLYTRSNLKDARWFLNVLKERYSNQLEPLLNAWSQLELYWQHQAMPLTNNVSETLYSALWSRSKKRVVKAFHRALDWFVEACFRWHHHLIRGESPWQRFTGQVSQPWLKSLTTPLKYSTDF